MNIRQRLTVYTTRRQSSILSASIVLAVTFAISAALGYLRTRFLYGMFFKCCASELDAYNAAFRLPDLIFKLLVTGALSASFIPVFSGYLHKDPKQANKIASTVINLLFLVFIGAAITLLMFTRPLSELIATGFTSEQFDLMVNLTRILLTAQIFFLISNFITAILQVNQIFLIPAFSPIVYNLFIILSIFTLAPRFGLYGVAYGAVVGAFFHLAIQIPIARRVGFNYSLVADTKLKGVREVVRLMIPRSLSLGLGEIENTVTLFFSSTLAVGSFSLLNLAMQLIYLPSRIFGTTVGQASLPILSKNIARNELNTFRQTVNKTLLQSLFISLPIATLLLILRLPVVRIAYGSRQFPWEATVLTAKTLAFLTPVIVCQAAIQILVRSFYALHNTKTPLHISTISLLTNIILNYTFIKLTDLGIMGLAISSSVSNIIQVSGLMFLFIKKVDGFNWLSTFKSAFRIFIASLAAGASTWMVFKGLDLFLLNTSRTINVLLLLGSTSAIGGSIYLILAHLLNIKEFAEYKKYFLKTKRFISAK